MSTTHFLRLATIAGSAKLIAAFRHNKRAIQKELGSAGHINPARSKLNYSLHGLSTPEALARQHKDNIKAAGIERTRKNAALAIEIIFSLPANATTDHHDYFTACLAWVAAQFGSKNILSADVHLDEAAPHCHVLLTPLLNGRLRATDLMGDRAAMLARQTDFFEKVSKHYGFTKPVKLSHQAKESVTKAVLAHLRATQAPSLKCATWAFLRDCIGRDPLACAQSLGLSIEATASKRKHRTMAQIFTSAGKGNNKETNNNENTYRGLASKNTQPLCSVGVSLKPIELEATNKTLNHQVCNQESAIVITLQQNDKSMQGQNNDKVLKSVDPSFEVVRVRDSELSPDWFNSETGEFIKPLLNVKNNRAAASSWVSGQLRQRRSLRGGFN